MSIFSRIAATFSNNKNANADSVYPGTWVPMGGSSDGVNSRNLLASNKEWVFVAVDKVATTVASVNFKVMQIKRSGEDQEVFDGPLAQFLEKPGQGLTGKDFIYLNTVYKELTGNAFWEKKKPGTKLQAIIPTQVAPIISGGKLTGYKITEGASQRDVKFDDMLHDRYIDPARPYWGAGKLQKIARWADVSQITGEMLSTLFRNGGVFGGFIETEEETNERVKLIKAGLANDHTGVSKWFKWAVLPKGAKATPVKTSIADMEMGATDDRYRDKILSAFGVPKSLVGLVEDVNRANAEANEYVFAKYTIKPIVVDMIEFLNVYVAPILDPTGKTYFDYEEFVPVNMEIELRKRELQLNRQQTMTVNEARAEDGLPPIKGGDDIYTAPFQQPLGQPQQAPEPSDDDEDEEPEPTPAKSRPRAVQARFKRIEKRENSLDLVSKRIASRLAEKMEDISTTADVDEAVWKNFVGRVETYQEQLQDRIRQYNARQQKDILNRLNNITKAVNKSDIFDLTAEMVIMIDVVGPLLRGLLTEQAVAEYVDQGFAGTFDNGSEAIGKIVNVAAKRLGKSYNQTTLKLLKNALNQGVNEGDSLAQLTKRVNDVYEYSDIVRAKMTAHTEAFYIANKGNVEAYRQSGVVKTQRWYTAEDERVCEFCNPMNGKIVDVGQRYFKKGETLTGEEGGSLTLNYRSIYEPPLHVNCRCMLRPETIEIG